MTRHPNIPPLIESEDSEARDPGIQSSVHIAGHPIHPILVAFPIATLVLALGSDLGYWVSADPFWARTSLWLIAVGLGAAILAAVTGMLDFLRIKRVRQRTAGRAHMLTNAAILVLTLLNLGVRLGDPVAGIYPLGLPLSILVALLLGLSGWWGGELVYRHKVGVIGYGSRTGS
ncbi:DUF2231 domain-containing protein [Anthocerotibacter panamensis]|uniref:DUF2231 domain-containing protein n=1 Tax=Anthocerotibacter panamensis TaxID=2857077 RepID=UPI001C401954|nr:DUF2231 domain-containing protein [Anthocerotibacter panamensis]